MNCNFNAAARKTSTIILAAALIMLATTAYSQKVVFESNRVAYVNYGVSPGSPFSRPLCIFFDKTLNECYVADTGNSRIVICDINGMPIHSFYHRIIQNGQIAVGEPKSIVVNSKGKIFLTDTKVPYIDILDPLGRSIDRVSASHEGCGEDGRFDFLALGSEDEVFAVLSCEKNHVAVIGPDLTITRIISLYSPEQTRSCVSAIAISESGEMVITYPCAEIMVQIFSPVGEFLRGFGKHETGFENFSYPTGIALMSNGDIWIADAIRQIASRFSRDGQFLSYIGGKGIEVGALRYPSSIASDGDKLLFVLERVGQRYQCFQLTGNDKRDEETDYSLSKSVKTSKSK
jgi:DNA-binding beta-propeller fold protein YncE